jgi:hypothetical protein
MSGIRDWKETQEERKSKTLPLPPPSGRNIDEGIHINIDFGVRKIDHTSTPISDSI